MTRHGMASCGTRGCARVHLGLGCNAAVDTSVPRNCPPSTRVHTLTASPRATHVLPQVENNQVTAMYVSDDVRSYATESSVGMEDVEDTLAYSKALKIIGKSGVKGEVVPTFNSYHQLETW